VILLLVVPSIKVEPGAVAIVAEDIPAGTRSVIMDEYRDRVRRRFVDIRVRYDILLKAF
jgi:hypothetical protein